jgi:hypothetical protein
MRRPAFVDEHIDHLAATLARFYTWSAEPELVVQASCPEVGRLADMRVARKDP